ncbi:MAG: helix-turn-helix domain-containing protein [Ruminococcaceae bacterium]|nr:helix-turn-helix domain-containing protein [Oscillospiraceae bacterium]
MLTNSFYADIQKIHVAHQYTLDRMHVCTYPKGRGHYGLVFALRGEAEYRFSSGEQVQMATGNLLFLSPDTAYTIITSAEFEHYTVNFVLHEEQSDLGVAGDAYCLLQSEDTAPLERVFRKLVRTWEKKAAGYEMQAVGILYELLTLFYSYYTEERRSLAYCRLLPAKEYVEEHYDKAVSLTQLAFLTDMSPSHFRREWKRFFTESPLQYRDSIRLSYAKEYLFSGYYTVGEVAKKCGFEDVSYFVRFFKKKTGMTPGEVKKDYFGV